MTDLIGNLERLQKLRDAGTLTEAEFETQKNIVLALNDQYDNEQPLPPSVITEHDLKTHAALKGKRRFSIYKWIALIIAFWYISLKYDFSDRFDDNISKILVVVCLIGVNFALKFVYKYAPIAAISIVACIFSLLPYEIFSFIIGPIGGYLGALCGFISVCIHGYNGSQFFAKEETDDTSMLHPAIQVGIAAVILSGSYYVFSVQLDGERLPEQNAATATPDENQNLVQPANEPSAADSLVESVWDCKSVYGERIFVAFGRDTFTFAPRNPEGGKLTGRLIKKPKEISADGTSYNTYLTLEGSGTQPDQWSIYEENDGPALFHFSELSGDGSECVEPGQQPKYSTN